MRWESGLSQRLSFIIDFTEFSADLSGRFRHAASHCGPLRKFSSRLRDFNQ